MKQCGPDWSGPLNCPPEQEFFGLSTVEAPAREGHLEGAARWAPIHGRSRGGRGGRGVAPGGRIGGRSGGPTGADASVVACAGGCPSAAQQARPEDVRIVVELRRRSSGLT